MHSETPHRLAFDGTPCHIVVFKDTSCSLYPGDAHGRILVHPSREPIIPSARILGDEHLSAGIREHLPEHLYGGVAKVCILHSHLLLQLWHYVVEERRT